MSFLCLVSCVLPQQEVKAQVLDCACLLIFLEKSFSLCSFRELQVNA